MLSFSSLSTEVAERPDLVNLTAVLVLLEFGRKLNNKPSETVVIEAVDDIARWGLIAAKTGLLFASFGSLSLEANAKTLVPVSGNTYI